MYNLLITAKKDAWNSPSFVYTTDRFLEFTDEELVEQFGDLGPRAIEKLTNIPSLFAYEEDLARPARVGRITSILRRSQLITIEYRFKDNIPPISSEAIENLASELDLDLWEMSRTHWALKDIDLLEVLRNAEILEPTLPVVERPKRQVKPTAQDLRSAHPLETTLPDLERSSRQIKPKVFLVHGRDDGAKHEVARYLEGLGLDVVILHERPNGGRSLISKFREESKGIQFAVVLMTPDDKGYFKDEQEKRRPRARQNVVFELGFFIGKLGPEKVCALVAGDIEKPSDFEAVVYVPYGPGTDWKLELARELDNAKVPIDHKGVLGPRAR